MTTTPTKNESLPELSERLRGLAAVIRKHGTCAPLALEMVAYELEAALTREAPTEGVVRDREADRERYPDKAFNEWLDAGISDAGHTVYDSIGNIADAWQGWFGHVVSVMLDEPDPLFATSPAPQRMAIDDVEKAAQVLTVLHESSASEQDAAGNVELAGIHRDAVAFIGYAIELHRQNVGLPDTDGCTEPNCPRCLTAPHARGDMPHAGIGAAPQRHPDALEDGSLSKSTAKRVDAQRLAQGEDAGGSCYVEDDRTPDTWFADALTATGDVIQLTTQPPHQDRGEVYPDGVTAQMHIAHDMRVGRFPERSTVAEFTAERHGLDDEALTKAEDYYYDHAPFNGPAELRDGIAGCIGAYRAALTEAKQQEDAK